MDGSRAMQHVLSSAGVELRSAGRRLLRQPGFTAPAVLTLALATGATTAVFALLDAVVLRPLPYASAERLVYIDSPVPGVAADARWGLGRHELFHFKENARSIEELGLFMVSSATVTGDAAHEAQRARVAVVSASLFDALSFRPSHGRLLTADDNLPDVPTAVVLSHRYWQRRFGGDVGLVGRSIDIEGLRIPVVGVLPPGADLPDLTVDLWLPDHVDPAMPARNNHVRQAIGRLRRGFTAADAQVELAALTTRFEEVFPTAYSPEWLARSRFTTEVQPLRDHVVGDAFRRALWVLFGAVALLLLIASANVANLFLARLEARHREVAIRAALGAGRGQLAAHHFAEVAVLVVAAAAGAVVLASAALRVLLARAPSELPRLAEVGIGWPALVAAVAAAAAGGAFLGLLGVTRTRIDAAALRDGGRGTTVSRRRQAIRGGLVISQVALALVLLVGAGLMVRSYRNLMAVRPGFDAADVTTLEIALPAGHYDSYERISAFYSELSARAAALPGVQAVGFGQSIPMAGEEGCTAVVTEAEGAAPREACVLNVQVSAGYFEALGVRVSGRIPDWSDNQQRSGGVVVSRALAQQLWPGEDPIGKGIRCCQSGPVHYRVVGVTDDVRGNGFDRPVTSAVYFPLLPIEGAPIEGMPRFMHAAIRAPGASVHTLEPAIRRLVAELDPQVPVENVRSLEGLVARSMARRSFTMVLLGVASGMALLLSAVGIYGVVAYLVGRRRAEIGIRMALGATTRSVGGMVVAQALRVAAIGVVLGVAGALLSTRLLRSLLFELSPSDPATLVAVSLFLLGLAAAASFLPARRAMRVSPLEALRQD